MLLTMVTVRQALVVSLMLYSWTYSIRLGVSFRKPTASLGVVYSDEIPSQWSLVVRTDDKAAGEFHTITLELHPDGRY